MANNKQKLVRGIYKKKKIVEVRRQVRPGNVKKKTKNDKKQTDYCITSRSISKNQKKCAALSLFETRFVQLFIYLFIYFFDNARLLNKTTLTKTRK